MIHPHNHVPVGVLVLRVDTSFNIIHVSPGVVHVIVAITSTLDKPETLSIVPHNDHGARGIEADSADVAAVDMLSHVNDALARATPDLGGGLLVMLWLWRVDGDILRVGLDDVATAIDQGRADTASANIHPDKVA